MKGASALRPRKRPIAATTTANGLLAPIGRMMKRSTPIEAKKAITADNPTAGHSGTPPSASHHARKQLNIAISPWAKFRCPEPR